MISLLQRKLTRTKGWRKSNLFVQGFSRHLSVYRTEDNIIKCRQTIKLTREKEDLYWLLEKQFKKHAEKTALVKINNPFQFFFKVPS